MYHVFYFFFFLEHSISFYWDLNSHFLYFTFTDTCYCLLVFSDSSSGTIKQTCDVKGTVIFFHTFFSWKTLRRIYIQAILITIKLLFQSVLLKTFTLHNVYIVMIVNLKLYLKFLKHDEGSDRVGYCYKLISECFNTRIYQNTQMASLVVVWMNFTHAYNRIL